MSRTREKLSNSRIMEIWRSVLSWMRWHLKGKRRQRRQQELDELKERLLFSLLMVLPTQEQVEEIVHRQLMLAMTPLAQALNRQDDLLMEQVTRMRVNQRLMENNLEDLLKEVLNSLQPKAEEVLLDGHWTRPLSYPSSES